VILHPSQIPGMTPPEWERICTQDAIQSVHEATGLPLRHTLPCGCWWRLTEEGTYRAGGSCEAHPYGRIAEPDFDNGSPAGDRPGRHP
jgi:hypothetical protein